MMKQIKFWSILLLTVMLMPLVASCGGDDGDDGGNTGNPIVGTWRAEKKEKGILQYWEMTFNADFSWSAMEYNKFASALTNR